MGVHQEEMTGKGMTDKEITGQETREAQAEIITLRGEIITLLLLRHHHLLHQQAKVDSRRLQDRLRRLFHHVFPQDKMVQEVLEIAYIGILLSG